jgi:hypothetical protein
MTRRTALVGPFQVVRVDAVNDAANVEPFLENLPRLNVPELWYSSVIQAGVEKLELFSTIGETPIKSSILQKRITWHDSPEFTEKFFIVEHAFRNHFGVKPESDLDKSLSKLKNFIVELLLATHRKQSLVYFDQIPDTKALEKILPIDLLLPFRNLFLTLQENSPKLASVKGTLAIQDITIFEEIIAGKAFFEYEQSQRDLDDGQIPVSAAIKTVENLSHRLVSSSPLLLKTKRVAISLLPLSSKIIDTVFGKLPGSLAEFFTSLLTKWLQDNQRLIIYQFDDLLKLTMESRMHDLFSKKFSDKQ